MRKTFFNMLDMILLKVMRNKLKNIISPLVMLISNVYVDSYQSSLPSVTRKK